MENGLDMNLVIAENLKRLRQEKRLSLSEVSEQTGVSKSMLGQIERGESSPTISTLWKIATGLEVSFTSLMERVEEEAPKVVPEAELRPVLSDNGRFRLYPVFPASRERSFEIVDLELDPGAVSESRPHAAGTEEFVLVYEGELTVLLGEERKRYPIPARAVMHYQGDQAHVYRNDTDGVTRAVMVIYYHA